MSEIGLEGRPYGGNQIDNSAIAADGKPASSRRLGEPLDEEAVHQEARRLVQQARDFYDSDIKDAQERGFRYLNGKVDAEAPAGRSKVVMTAVRDACDQMMPQLIELFGDLSRVVAFDPTSADDWAFAQDATTYVNFVYSRDNAAWRNTHDFIRDALEAKYGVFLARWSADDKVAEESYDSLSPEELVGLLEQPDVELVKAEVHELQEETGATDDGAIAEPPGEQADAGRPEDAGEGAGEAPDDASASPVGAPAPAGGMPPIPGMPPGAAPGGPPSPGAAAGMPGMPPGMSPPAPPPEAPPEPPKVIKATVRRKATKRKVTVEVVPPEELLIDRYATCASDALIIGRDTELTISDLIALGLDPEAVEEAASASSGETDDVKEQRAGYTRSKAQLDTLDPSLKTTRVVRCWARIDADGDGIAEWHSMILVGAGLEVLRDEVVGYPQMVVASGWRKPHEAIGRSLADRLTDMQDIETALMRGVLDNLYSVNRPRRAVVEGMVNWDDLMNDQHEGNVRVRQPGMIQDLTVPFVGGQTLPVMDFLEKRKEQRTGISAASAGLDPDALQSSTAVGVVATINAAQAMIKMAGRTLAEDGFAPLFKLILRLIIDHQAGPRVVQIRGAAKVYDPAGWNSDMDITVDPALGRGDQDEKIKALGGILSKQETILAQLGPSNPICDLADYSRALHDMADLMGVKNSFRYFKPPEEVDKHLQAQAQQPPPPDPEQQKVQLKLVETQGKQQIAQQAAQQKGALAAQQAQAKQQQQQQKAELDMAEQTARAQADIQANAAKTQSQIEAQDRRVAAEIGHDRMKLETNLQHDAIRAAAQAHRTVTTPTTGAA